jgi:hypothetical protein
VYTFIRKRFTKAMNIKFEPAKLFLLFSAICLLLLSACGAIKTTQLTVSVPITSETQLWGNETGLPGVTTVSREQAIAIAGTQFPSGVILLSTITAQITPNDISGTSGSNYLWDVAFDDFTITRDALVAFGWSLSDSNTWLLNYSEYRVADIYVDSQTGAIVRKVAAFVRIGPPPLSTTSSSQLAVNFEPKSGEVVTPGIVLDQVAASVGVLPFDGVNPWGLRTISKSGSPCVLVSGAFVNVSNQAWQLDFWADGFSPSGQVSWTLDSGALAGHVQAVLAPGEKHYFTLHLNWAEAIVSITVTAHTYSTAIPLP